MYRTYHGHVAVGGFAGCLLALLLEPLLLLLVLLRGVLLLVQVVAVVVLSLSKYFLLYNKYFLLDNKYFSPSPSPRRRQGGRPGTAAPAPRARWSRRANSAGEQIFLLPPANIFRCDLRCLGGGMVTEGVLGVLVRSLVQPRAAVVTWL